MEYALIFLTTAKLCPKKLTKKKQRVSFGAFVRAITWTHLVMDWDIKDLIV